MIDESEVICWRLKDYEEGNADTIADLICELEEDGELDSVISVEGTIEITGYKKKELDISSYAENVLDSLVESLDEEIGLDDYTEITKEMRDISETFVKDIISEYTSYGLEEVVTKTIKVSEYKYT